MMRRSGPFLQGILLSFLVAAGCGGTEDLYQDPNGGSGKGEVKSIVGKVYQAPELGPITMAETLRIGREEIPAGESCAFGGGLVKVQEVMEAAARVTFQRSGVEMDTACRTGSVFDIPLEELRSWPESDGWIDHQLDTGQILICTNAMWVNNTTCIFDQESFLQAGEVYQDDSGSPRVILMYMGDGGGTECSPGYEVDFPAASLARWPIANLPENIFRLEEQVLVTNNANGKECRVLGGSEIKVVLDASSKGEAVFELLTDQSEWLTFGECDQGTQFWAYFKNLSGRVTLVSPGS